MASALVGANDPQGFQQKLSAQEEELKKLRRELEQARMKSASAATENAAESAVQVKGCESPGAAR